MSTKPSNPGPTPSAPPTLSDSDRALLFAYFDHHENLAALAAHLAAVAADSTPAEADSTSAEAASPLMPDAQCLMPSSDYFSLLTWLNQPHIQEALDQHDQAVARADRRRSLDALRQSLDSADNPTNLRRAATTLLRSTLDPASRADRKPDRQGGRLRSSSDGAPSSPPPPTLSSPPSPSHLHHPTLLPPLPPLPPSLPPPAPHAGTADHSAHIHAAQPDAGPPHAPCSDPPADSSPTNSPVQGPLPEARDPEHPLRQSG